MPEISTEVADALAAGRPVVALESTIITHGMPAPRNREMALEVEGLLRAEGVVPATVAVLDGVARVGLSETQIDRLATARGVAKASTRDLPALLAAGTSGATTVAATMWLAARAGVHVFATGGLGGVHRGAASTMDISADLTQLATTPVAVVSAGVKSILDIGLTLEHLETLGVPVVVVGSDTYPSFYSRESDFAAPRRIDDVGQLAALLEHTWTTLGMRCGVAIANPVPPEAEIPRGEIDAAIEAALRRAGDEGISGQAVTPFLLAEIVRATSGRSLETNVALMRANALLGARLATAFARLRR